MTNRERYPLSGVEAPIVDLIERGFTRWKIAEELELSESTIRAVIRRLCERYDCSMQRLPEVIPPEER